MTRRANWLLILAALLLASPQALAQGKGRDKHAQVEERLKQIRTRVLKKEVGLDEKKATEVQKVLDKHAPERKMLRLELRTQREAIRKLLDDDSDDQAAYKKALEGLRAAHKKLAELRNREIDELSKLLTPKQQAKLLMAVRKLERKMPGHRGRDEF
jgi:Spy/CpxP family protein refolding chaperone